MSFTVYPRPRHVRLDHETVDHRQARWIRVEADASAGFKQHAVSLARDLAEGMPVRPQVTAGDVQAGDVLLRVELGACDLCPQSYRLRSTTNGMLLEASSESGAFYGFQTLRQIWRQTGPVGPAFDISDAPDFERRGVMLDVSRCKVPTRDTLFMLVDRLSTLKINELQLYTEHTFAFSGHERVWFDASPLTAEDVLALDRYCRDRYIDLVPNFNSFGHFGRWLCHPEYRHLAECPDGYEHPGRGRVHHGSVLRPDRTSVDLLDTLYDELLPNFSSDRFNVGCDETWELGQGASKVACETRGRTRVYLDFLLDIHRLVQKRGHRMMFWGDIILHEPELIAELPSDIIALNWGYEARHPFEKTTPHFAAAGIPFYVCPGTSSWNSLVGRVPNCLANIANAARNGLEYGAAGLLTTDWGDGGHHQYLPFSYPGYVAGAVQSWCFDANRDVPVADALDRLFFDDAAGALGGLFCELGSVYERVPSERGNRSTFNELLFWDMSHPETQLEGFSDQAFGDCLDRFADLEARLADARPQACDGDLVKAEFINGLAMARHAVHRARAARNPGRDTASLRHELQHIISRHEDLWLARNRRGGLRESSERLRASLTPLEE